MRCLVLTTDHGHGHRSAANAVATALRGHGAEVMVCNPLHETDAPALLRRTEHEYLRMVERDPAAYGRGYAASQHPLLLGSTARLILALGRPVLRQVLARYPAERVVCTFPLLAAGVAGILGEHCPPLLSIGTDLGPLHPLWFAGGAGGWALASTSAQQSALQAGVDTRRIVVTGVPIHPAFASQPPRAALRHMLGWQQELPTVLLASGGAGIGQIEALAHALDQCGARLQLAIATGSNTALAERLRTQHWRVPTHIYGPLPNLAAPMHAADIVLARAGGLSVSEALAAGKPLVLHSATPGQEQGNRDFVCAAGAAIWAESPRAACHAIRVLAENPEHYARTAAAARRLGLPAASETIAQLVLAGWQPYPQPSHTAGATQPVAVY